MEKGRIVIMTAGTGNPYFSTDTAAALRANELKAEVLIKATNVDGIYSADPRLEPDAKFLAELSYLDVIKRQLRFMDLTAITMCKDNKVPVIIFNQGSTGNLKKVVLGEKIGSLVTD